MAYVSVLVPAFYHGDPSEDLIKICSDFFGLDSPSNNFELYELVPLKMTKNLNLKNKEIAMKMPKTELNLKYIETLMEENAQLKIQVDKCKDAIKILTTEYNKISTTPNLLSPKSQGVPGEIDPKITKKLKKMKQMEEDNKRLRQLLKAQLENSEKMRLETQTTVETLKGEFDLLVKEISSVHKKDDNSVKSSNQASSVNISETNAKDRENTKSSGDINYQQEDDFPKK